MQASLGVSLRKGSESATGAVLEKGCKTKGNLPLDAGLSTNPLPPPTCGDPATLTPSHTGNPVRPKSKAAGEGMAGLLEHALLLRREGVPRDGTQRVRGAPESVGSRGQLEPLLTAMGAAADTTPHQLYHVGS